MPSFTDALGRLAAEGVHKKRKSADGDHTESVRAALAKQWEEKDKPAALEAARSNATGVYTMKVFCEHEIHEKDMLKLLPDELADDVKRHQIDCHKHNESYVFELYFGHKRDAFLDEMERDDPSPFAKTQRLEGKDEVEKGEEPQGDAALEVQDDDVVLTKESVATRVERVKGMTDPKHVDIMTRAVEALGWCTDYDKVHGMAVFVQWQRALLNQGRKASLAYAAAIAEVEASA